MCESGAVEKNWYPAMSSSVIDNDDTNKQRAVATLSYYIKKYVRTNEEKDFVSNTWQYFYKRINRFMHIRLPALNS